MDETEFSAIVSGILQRHKKHQALPIFVNMLRSEFNDATRCFFDQDSVAAVATIISIATELGLSASDDSKYAAIDFPPRVNTNLTSPPPTLINLEPGQAMPLPRNKAPIRRSREDLDETLLKD